MASEVILETRNLTRIYGRDVEIRALDGVSFAVRRGEMVAVMGASGSGKSTLLNMVGALDSPTSGQVLIEQQDLSSIRDIDRFRSQTVGFVFQMHNLIPTLTAVENVEVPLRGQGFNARQRRQRAQQVLDMVGLADRLTHLPSQLSGGQRQRTAIARAMIVTWPAWPREFLPCETAASPTSTGCRIPSAKTCGTWPAATSERPSLRATPKLLPPHRSAVRVQ